MNKEHYMHISTFSSIFQIRDKAVSILIENIINCTEGDNNT